MKYAVLAPKKFWPSPSFPLVVTGDHGLLESLTASAALSRKCMTTAHCGDELPHTCAVVTMQEFEAAHGLNVLRDARTHV